MEDKHESNSRTGQACWACLAEPNWHVDPAQNDGLVLVTRNGALLSGICGAIRTDAIGGAVAQETEVACF